MTASRSLTLGLAVAALIAVVDQLSKWWIVAMVMQPPRVIAIAPFFNLVLGWNRGVSFGILNTESPVAPWLLVIIAGVIVAVLGIWLAKAEARLIAFALGAVIGGAVGNVIDRLRYGAVADFLDFHAFGYHWPAFNVADSAISLGAAALILDSLFRRPGPTKLPQNN
jgi:signal peptidase II